jgi:MFS family permease
LFDAAAGAMLPDIVPPSRLTGANSIMTGIRTAADLAYAVGGGMVFVLKLELPFYIDAATFVFSGLMILGMRVPQHKPQSVPSIREVTARIREGITYVLDHPYLKWNTLTFIFAPIAGGAGFVLMPLYAAQSLAHSPGLIGPLRSAAFRFSVLEVAFGSGALLGSALTPVLARRWSRGLLFALGLSGFGVSFALLALIANLYLAAVVILVAGMFNSLFIISGGTLVQALTSSEVRGRVLAARMTVVNSALAIGSAIAGPGLLVFTYSAMWLLLGATVTACSLVAWFHPVMRSQD